MKGASARSLLVVFAAALPACGAGGPAPATAPAASVPAATKPPSPTKPSVDQFRGICLQLHNGRADYPYERFIREIADAGANTICLTVSGYQENAESTRIYVDPRKTPPAERIGALIRYSRKRGMRVVLMPIVLLANPREGQWRGSLAPKKWDDWWDSYTAFLLRYARVARGAGADVYMVGSELISTETLTKRWRGLIRKVRGVYEGRLSYSANWDHYEIIEWWGDLDFIGLTTYYDLTGGKKPTVANLTAGWRPIKAEILKWRARVNRPIIFTEVGWPSQPTAGQYPWDYYRNPSKPDPAAQANCFEAFFRTWSGEKSVAGYLVWEWRNQPNQTGGPRDTSYIPCGKPAMKVIRSYFARPAPATQPAPPK